MTYSHRIAAAALIASLPANSLAAARNAPMEPNGKWTVDFGDAHCIAMRSYGATGNAVHFALKPSPMGDVTQLTVIRDGGRKVVAQIPGTVSIDGAKGEPVSMLVYNTNTKKRMNVVNMTAAAFAPLRGANAVRLRAPMELDEHFVLNGMMSVTKALDRCMTDLRKIWHIGDSERDVAQAARATDSLPNYFKSEDYPGVAIAERSTGTVALMLLIDERGKIASCMVTQTSGVASLDAQSCAILTARAKFAPAMNKAGIPIKSGQTARIKWALPGY